MNQFEWNLTKGSVFSVGIKKWKGLCFNCKKLLGTRDISKNMYRILLLNFVVVCVTCGECNQIHEVIGNKTFGGSHGSNAGKRIH